MRTYKLFKSSLVKEDYLNIKNAKLRRAITKFRISAHRLAIELVRYNKPPLPPEERICTACPNKPIEDEQHFILECHKYDTDRKRLVEEVKKRCSNFRYLDKQDKFVYLMTADTQIAGPVAKFISKNMP